MSQLKWVADIDGNRWSNDGFYFSDIYVKEGLAQYYTEKIVQKLEYKIPGIQTAYEKLLEKQTDAYLIYKKWINKMDIKPEIIRTTLVSLRKKETIKVDEFEFFLESTKNFSNKAK